MRKLFLLSACSILCLHFLSSCHHEKEDRVALIQAIENDGNDREDEEDGYDGPAQRDSLDFEKIKDPALGYVPTGRMMKALTYTDNLKRAARAGTTLLWVERGPIYDSVGPSNGNPRGGGGYTSGRMAAVLVDTLDDPSGNTVFCGGIDGGLWKCTNFLSAIPSWQVINDYFANLAISSICQDPGNPAIMYFSTGEATSNVDAVYGGGIWKSTDHGSTWTQLPSTTSFIRSFKILCDPAGNVYLAARTTSSPASQPFGLLRSKDKGATWTNVTPTGLTSSSTCTDIELSSTGRLHASFGYLNTVVNHRYTIDPANVTTTTGWNASTGLRTSGTAAIRFEMTCLADTLYGVTVNTGYNADSCYKSIDGGATWTKQNTAAFPTGVLSGQGWYNITLAINPANSSEFIVGGLDAYRSVNSGLTAASRLTFWVTTAPYVHADHHFMQWMTIAGESRVMIGCDGGLFLSRDGGVNWKDKNRNLSLKQFYAADIHPTAGSNYLLAGAQDNGCHQLKNAGLSYSNEVTGGDGCFVHINQQNPLIQFGSYVYNQYRRSVDGGNTWSSVNFSGSAGMFVNPWDYDDSKNIMYASYGSNLIMRWPNANTATAMTTLTLSGLGTPSCFKVSPNTADRVFIGSNTGKLYRLNNASIATAASLATDLTDITGASFTVNGYLSCVNTGSTDNVLVAVFSNYGINNVWYSTNAGTSWTAIDGNLPDMPVRWALVVPGHDDQIILATEAGIYTTDLVNGSSTVWAPNPGFPTVRTDMLKLRTSDNTIVAATHGRGLFTTSIPVSSIPAIQFISSSTNTTEIAGTTSGCRRYKDYTVNVGATNPPVGDATVSLSVQAGNSAVKGIDFDFTTNGDFSNPSTQLVFVNGVAAVKPVTVRIYDDAEVEATESFTLGFILSGTTNAVPGAITTHVFTIDDNDLLPVPYGLSPYNIGTYNTDLNSLNTPFDGTKLKHRLQVLFSAAELRASGMLTAASLSSMNIRVKTKNTTLPFKGFTISMANTASTNLNTGFVAGAVFTQVWTGDYNTVAGDNVFAFTTPFAWDGSSNVLVQFCFDNSPGVAEGVVDVVEGNTGPLGSFYASTFANYTTSSAAGCSLGAAFISTYRLDAVFGATLGTHVATALNAVQTEYLTSNNDVYFYASTGEIIARIHNLTAQNYGCTQVNIDRAGTGSSQFWNTNPANYLMNKSFRILPTTNNPFGQYELTLYYTKQEKEGWEAATGQSWNNIQLVKLPSPISTVTPLNAQPDGPGTVEVVTPVRGSFGTDYTLTYTFTDGFSGFGAGIPGRMNTVINLSGQVDNGNPANILLTWTTSAEINSKQFEVQKSYNGTDFHAIGTVTASGNKLSLSTYTLTDPENVQVNYYRVKMLHTDTLVLYSNTILVTNNNAPQGLIITPNPFDGEIGVRFRRVPSGSVACRLYDGAGKLIRAFPTVQASAGLVSYSFRTSGLLAHGIYIFEAIVDGKRFAVRVMKR